MKSRIRKRIFIPLTLLFLLVSLFLFQIWRSYCLLTVREMAISSPKLTDSVRLAVLADLHGSSFGEDNQTLVARLRALSPDLILLDGDMLNGDAADAETALSLIRQAADIAPVYASLGNHEQEYIQTHPQLCEQMTAAGAVVLDKTYVDIVVREQALRLGGMYDYAFAMDGQDSTEPSHMDPEVYAFLTDFQSTDAMKVMLSHRPDSFIFGEAAATWDADVVVSGHVHGGQVILPFVGGLWAPDQGWFPDYDAGQFLKDGLPIVITAGLGSQPEKLPRFNNPPEILLLTLSPAD